MSLEPLPRPDEGCGPRGIRRTKLAVGRLKPAGRSRHRADDVGSAALEPTHGTCSVARRHGPPAWRQRGSGWFEFAVVAVLLSVLALVFVHRLMDYQALAEQTAVDLSVRNMRSGLRWQVAERLMQGRSAEIAGLAGANPVAWLSQPPPGYLGELGPGEAKPDAGGSWYFDVARGQLAYVPRHGWWPDSGEKAATERRWQVQTLKSAAGAAVSAPVTSVVLVEAAPPQ